MLGALTARHKLRPAKIEYHHQLAKPQISKIIAARVDRASAGTQVRLRFVLQHYYPPEPQKVQLYTERDVFALRTMTVALQGYSTRNHRQRRIDGECEARLIAALCGPAPEGYARWSLRLLADKAVELKIIAEPISYETVRQALQANELKP